MKEIEQLKAIFEKYGIRPNKALGQNFLIDGEVLERIADLANIEGASVLEIGPGLGALTGRLLKRTKRIEAVEKDAFLAGVLRELFPDEKLGITCGDILKTDPDVLLERPYHVVGNLPYYITTDIAERMLCLSPESLTFLVQKEAAERFFACPGDRVYGPLAVLSSCAYHSERGFDVSAGCFYPQPEVESSVVHLVKKSGEEGVKDPAGFLRFLKRCFLMRRKTLNNCLKGTAGLGEAFSLCDIEGGVRAEALPPEKLYALYLALK